MQFYAKSLGGFFVIMLSKNYSKNYKIGFLVLKLNRYNLRILKKLHLFSIHFYLLILINIEQIYILIFKGF